MNNKTIILHSKDGDIELLKELRKALISKGFADDEEWNDEREGTRYIPIQVIANDIVYLKTTLGGEVRLPRLPQRLSNNVLTVLNNLPCNRYSCSYSYL